MKKLLIAIFIISVSIIGCDIPYTGPILSVDDVDRYLKSTGEDTVCLQDGFDSICIKVIQEEDDSSSDVPIVHIHPLGVMYEFYYEGRRVLRAERTMDTTQLVQELMDTKGTELPQNGEQSDAEGEQDNKSGDISRGWTIQIYYPDSFRERDRGSTPKTSGFDIRVVEGTKLPTHTRNDLEIENFTQTDGSDGSRSVQFFVETEASAITIRVGKLVRGHNANFRINVDGVVADEGANTFQLQPTR